ncbi:general transcription factor 3C polypeptide 1-like [Argonauta hians]
MAADFVGDLLDEVALEGLDGTTLSTLWIRLKDRPNFAFKIDEQSKKFIWNSLVIQDQLQFYELPTDRLPLVTINHFDYQDPSTGQWIEAAKIVDCYPIEVVKDNPCVQGSCSTYSTRLNITNQIRSDDYQKLCSLEEAEALWGERMIIVASQNLRSMSLFGPDRDPNMRLLDLPYCILERIGRSRFIGELTRGHNSLAVFSDSPKLMFHYFKLLIRLSLVRKQVFAMTNVVNKQVHTRLLHLPRFYSEKKSRYMVLLERLTSYLKTKYSQQEEVAICKDDIGIDDQSFKKLCRASTRYVRIFSMSYRDMYPDSEIVENVKNKRFKEKTVRVIQMIREYGVEEDDDEEEIESDEEGDDAAVAAKDDKSKSEPIKLLWERPFIQQANDLLECAGPGGMSLKDMMKCMNISTFESRSVLKYLTRTKASHSVMLDVGRQRKAMYISYKFANTSKLHMDLEKERNKMEQLIKSTPKLPSKSTPQLGISPEEINEDSAPHDSSSLIDQQDANVVPVMNLPEEDDCKKPRLTSKVLQRTNWIIEAVQEAKLVDKTFALKNMILNKEKAMGESTQIDKKSVDRILRRLQKSGQIRLIKTIIKTDNKQKELTFICDPSITPDHQIVKSAIEQAKLKYFGVCKEHLRESERMKMNSRLLMKDMPPSVQDSVRKLHDHRSKMKACDMRYDPSYMRKYGVLPKFRKAETVHKLLWYLIYADRNMSPIPSDQIRKDPALEVKADPDTDITTTTSYDSPQALIPETDVDGNVEWNIKSTESVPPVYVDDNSWRRYLAPLPLHSGFQVGWCLISDVLLLLPLQLFCQIVSLPYKINGLKEFLADPVKRYYPITYLPFKLTQQLLYARRYIFTFYEVCTLLCQMGLLSFGDQVLKEKDQVFIYLHKNAKLVDTKSSVVGYCQVRPPEGENFPIESFYLDSWEVLENYWFCFRVTALNTPLGRYHKVVDEVKWEEEHGVAPVSYSLSDAQSAKTPETIFDNGAIPGDGLGAAGFDSSLFCHISRNWFWYAETSQWKNIVKEKRVDKKSSDVMSPLHPNIFEENSLSQRLPRLFGPKKRLALDKNKETADKGEYVNEKGAKSKVPLSKIPKPKKRKLLGYLNKGLKKKAPKRTEMYDERDKLALKSKTKERVVWSQQEDSFLLLCKVTNLFMENRRPNVLSRMIVSWTKIRDLLMDKYPDYAKDKTSKACQRRVSFVLKNPQTVLNVSAFLQEALHDPRLMEDFGYMRFKYVQDDETDKIFEALVNRLIDKFSSDKYTQRCDLPNSLNQLNNNYILTQIGKWKKVSEPKDITRVDDIYATVLHNIIHCYLSLNDKQGRAHEMFRLFNQYPESLMSEVFAQMQSDRMITRVKKKVNKNKPREADLSSLNTHQLSQKYNYYFVSRFPTTLFSDVFEMVELVESASTEGYNVSDLPKGGYAAFIVSIVGLQLAKFDVTIPEKIIVLDPEGLKSNPIGRGKVSKANATEDDSVADGDFQECENSPKSLANEFGCADMQANMRKRPRDDSMNKDSFVDDDAGPSAAKSKPFAPNTSKPLVIRPHNLPRKANARVSRVTLSLARSENITGFNMRELNPQDNFVINSCIVKVSLLSSLLPKFHGNTEKDTLLVESASSSGDILWITEKVFKNIIRKQYQLVPSPEEVSTIWDNLQRQSIISARDIGLLQQVYGVIEREQSMGIRKFDLQYHFHNRWLQVKSCVNVLEKHQLILKVGITVERYVSVKYARPWIIHAFKNTRGRSDQSSIEEGFSDLLSSPEEEYTKSVTSLDESNIADSGASACDAALNALKQLEAECNSSNNLSYQSGPSSSSNNTFGIPSNSQMPTGSSQLPSEQRFDDREEDDVILLEGHTSMAANFSMNKRIKKKPAKLSLNEETSTLAPSMSTYKKVRVLCRPWRKPEGLLNRNVLKMMLESLLFFIMSKPGVSEETIFAKYNPVLQPVPIKELLGLLEDIGCVTKTILRKPRWISVFSKTSPIEEIEEDYEGDAIMYDVTLDGTLRMGQFMSHLMSSKVSH